MSAKQDSVSRRRFLEDFGGALGAVAGGTLVHRAAAAEPAQTAAGK